MDAAQLKKKARSYGATLAGVADLARLSGIATDPANLLAPFTRAVSLAVRVSDPVLDAIRDRPTPLYAQHYLRLNALLDDVAVRLALDIQEAGGQALALPASQTLDRVRWISYLSHKAVAVAAGLGWQGKSLLVITPKFGPRVRLVTVLTDLPLVADKPLKNRCGTCTACQEACPAQAIKGASTASHYQSRDEALHFTRCMTKVTTEFARLPMVEHPICGVCVAVCPWGRRKAKTRGRVSAAK